MYKTQSNESSIDGETCILYGIADENGFYSDFTTDENLANKFADFLNENEVEPCHVAEIIEDFFYSCGDNAIELFSKTE